MVLSLGLRYLVYSLPGQDISGIHILIGWEVGIAIFTASVLYIYIAWLGAYTYATLGRLYTMLSEQGFLFTQLLYYTYTHLGWVHTRILSGTFFGMRA